MVHVNKERRAGFTLVELLVVIAIIGVLVALLLPAVQAAREAARRMTCQNHLKQMGLAMQNHHDTYGIYPDGGIRWDQNRTKGDGGAPMAAPRQAWGLFYQMLPFMEQQSLYDNGDDALVRRSPVGGYFCPSRREPIEIGGRAHNDYAGNAGLMGGGLNGWGDGKNGGVFVRATAAESIDSASITDGTSNTIGIGEKWMGQSEYSKHTCADNEGYTSGFDWDIVRWGDNPPRKDVLNNDNCKTEFGSAHAGGAHFVYCDGSVHMINFTIDQTTFRNLSQRDDGQVTSTN